MAIQSEATDLSTTVDPQKWLGISERWCPAVPRAEHVASINSLIEAAGQHRVEWLDEIIVHIDDHERKSGSWKSSRLKLFAENMRKDPRYLPRLKKLRGSRDYGVVLQILRRAARDMSNAEILAVFREYRGISPNGLNLLLAAMVRLKLIARRGDGVHGLRRSADEHYESLARRIFKLVVENPGTTPGALCAATGRNSAQVGAAIDNLRQRGLFDRSAIALSADARSAVEGRETIFDKKERIFWAPEVPKPAPVDLAAFTSVTALRREQPVLEDAEADAEIEELMRLPEPEYQARRPLVASRVGMRVSRLDRERAERQRALAAAREPPALSRAELKAKEQASLKACEDRYLEMIWKDPGRREAKASDVIEEEMMKEFDLVRDQVRKRRGAAIKRYEAEPGARRCRWGHAGKPAGRAAKPG
jgi:hypothetical protein